MAETMKKFEKSQMLLLSLLGVLLSITPLLSSSLRTPYLYFVINVMIIALGAEAGLLSSFSKPSEDQKRPVCAAPKPAVTSEASTDKWVPRNAGEKILVSATTEKKAKVFEKSASEKIVGAVKMEKVKKCPSTPSLFFIGGGEGEAENMGGEYYEEEEEEVSGQELYTKAEMFIGNFYKQLKMQREESWKRIHDFYQRTF